MLHRKPQGQSNPPNGPDNARWKGPESPPLRACTAALQQPAVPRTRPSWENTGWPERQPSLGLFPRGVLVPAGWRWNHRVRDLTRRSPCFIQWTLNPVTNVLKSDRGKKRWWEGRAPPFGGQDTEPRAGAQWVSLGGQEGGLLPHPLVLPLPKEAWEGRRASARPPTFPAVPCTSAGRWKQPKCPSVEEEGIHTCRMQIHGVSLSLKTEGSSVTCHMNEP